MRTTLTLDDDVADRIVELARESKMAFKVVINETLRRGLDSDMPEPAFLLCSYSGQLRPGIDDRRLNELAFEE